MFATAPVLRRLAIPFAVGTGFVFLAPAPPASAAIERFHRFEVVAQANFTLSEQCADGSTAQTFVSVIGGREKESETRLPTLENEFLTFLVQGSDCEGNFVSDRGTGEGDFAANRAITRSSVVGTITTSGGSVVMVEMRWSGTGELERTRNVTTFPGFRGVFVGREREASATGTVNVDGSILVDGTTDNAHVETLEDRNVTIT